MSTIQRIGVACVVSGLLAGGCAMSSSEPMDGDEHDAMANHAMGVDDLASELGPATKTAVAADGSYSAGSTWSGGTAPGPNDVVLIPAGKTVTVDSTTAVAKSIVVRGTLKFGLRTNDKLRVETLVIADHASLLVGDDAGGISAATTATIAIRDDLPVTQDSQRLARGIIAAPHAVVRMVSARPRAPFVTFSDSVGPGSRGNLATTAAVPASWQPNDQIVIPATEFTREWQPDMPAGTSSPTVATSRLKNEIRTIAAISRAGSPGITLDQRLAFQHLRADATNGKVRVHAANITRNIIVRSENTSGDPARSGHTMFMGNHVKLVGVLFDHMGRTNKRAVVSDPGLPASAFNVPGVNGAPHGDNFSNPRGRYAVHFHEAGPDAQGDPALVSNCAVVGTPGWGFVNHSSTVDFVDNVAFDFQGAGFVAEDGEETGSYVGNIAIGGKGNGEFSIQRTVFGNKPRMDQGDMGFTGDGFWLQSPDVVVDDNIAAGCKGAGFFFWTAGRFEPQPGGGHYTGRPLGRPLPAGVTPRQWDYDGDGAADANVIADMPLKSFTGNTAYGCNTGLRMRFVNNSNTNILQIRGKDLTSELLDPAGRAPIRARGAIRNSTFWNNLNGIHGSYLTNTDFSNITIIAARPAITAPLAGSADAVNYRAEAGEGAIGIDFHHQNSSNTLTNVTVKNYTTGLWQVPPRTPTTPPNVDPSKTTFSGCTEDVSDSPAPKGDDWFFQSGATDNVPDDPQ